MAKFCKASFLNWDWLGRLEQRFFPKPVKRRNERGACKTRPFFMLKTQPKRCCAAMQTTTSVKCKLSDNKNKLDCPPGLFMSFSASSWLASRAEPGSTWMKAEGASGQGGDAGHGNDPAPTRQSGRARGPQGPGEREPAASRPADSRLRPAYDL